MYPPTAIRAGSELLSRGPAADVKAPAGADPALPCRSLFLIFLKAGLSFGGGPGILAALERELVGRRRLVTRDDFLANYALARLVPSGTTTALAVVFGRRFAGFPGTLAAIAGLLLPGLTTALLLTLAYAQLQGGPLLPLLSATLLPAALACMAISAVRLGRDVFRPSVESVIALAACGATLLWGLHPGLILLAGGAVALTCGGAGGKESR